MSKHENQGRATREIPVKIVSEFSARDDQLKHRVAKKAYEIYERRGCCHGCDLDDWLEAERLVLAEMGPQTDERENQRRQGSRQKRTKKL